MGNAVLLHDQGVDYNSKSGKGMVMPTITIAEMLV